MPLERKLWLGKCEAGKMWHATTATRQTNKQTMAKKSDGNCCGKFSSTRESRFMEQIDDESERIESNWDRGK